MSSSQMPVLELPYLVERDHGWLRSLIDEHLRYVGRRQREWCERLSEPFEPHAPQKKLKEAARVLDRLAGDRVTARVPPPKIREILFRKAASASNRAEALAAASSELGLGSEEIDEHLFGDVRGERRLAPLAPWVSPATLAVETNQAMACSLIARSHKVVIRAEGGTRALVRYAKWRGLIATARRLQHRDRRAFSTPEFPVGHALELEFSGPLALFRHTRVYARALAGLLPRAAACADFSIHVLCRVGPGDRYARFAVTSRDPVILGRELPEFESRLEADFAEDFRALGSNWQLVREPEPIERGTVTIFPDFELIHRAETSRRIQLEIIGYWTREYLERKNFDTLLICLDERLGCGAEPSLLSGPRIVPFRRRIDAERVLEAIERMPRPNR